jgi:transcription antitermination factor NusG
MARGMSVSRCGPPWSRTVRSQRPPDEVIAAIRRHERNGAIDFPKRGPKVGDRVQIVSGPFTGQSGLCTQAAAKQIGALVLRTDRSSCTATPSN